MPVVQRRAACKVERHGQGQVAQVLAAELSEEPIKGHQIIITAPTAGTRILPNLALDIHWIEMRRWHLFSGITCTWWVTRCVV